MRIRLIDVANKAGVSKSTASQYINGRYEYMSADTKERIRLAIEDLNFVPNQLARSLKTEKTYTVGIIVSNIIGAIFSQAIRGIDDYCKKHNYSVLIYNTDFIESVERKSIMNLKALNADGIIVTSSGHINDLLNNESQGGLPIVHLHRDFSDLTINTVVSDYRKGAYEATKYLIGLGHTRIGIITRPYEAIPTRASRIHGVGDALKDSQLTLDEDLICVSKEVDDIKEIYTYLMSLENPPTVIFTMYSQITIDLLHYLNTIDLSVPDDISIIGFDDLPLCDLLKVPLTVVNQSAYELGEKAAELLLNKINNPNKDFDSITLPCDLIIRESCRKI